MIHDIKNQHVNGDDFTHSYEELQNLAKEKAYEVAKSLNIQPGDTGRFSIWTNEIPELICIADFKCNPDSSIIWNFDDSQSTL